MIQSSSGIHLDKELDEELEELGDDEGLGLSETSKQRRFSQVSFQKDVILNFTKNIVHRTVNDRTLRSTGLAMDNSNSPVFFRFP